MVAERKRMDCHQDMYVENHEGFLWYQGHRSAVLIGLLNAGVGTGDVT